MAKKIKTIPGKLPRNGPNELGIHVPKKFNHFASQCLIHKVPSTSPGEAAPRPTHMTSTILTGRGKLESTSGFRWEKENGKVMFQVQGAVTKKSKFWFSFENSFALEMREKWVFEKTPRHLDCCEG